MVHSTMFLGPWHCVLSGENGRSPGNLWQVPWGKHSLASWRSNHTEKHYSIYNKTATLPVVIIRDPYNWMQSMCDHPYTYSPERPSDRCPCLIAAEKGIPMPARITYSANNTAHFPSLAHIWNEYYLQYRNADYPRLMIRYEDMLFHHPEQVVLKTVCDCVQGDFVDSGFSLKVDNAKFSSGHGVQDAKGLLASILKSTDASRRKRGLTSDELDSARQSAVGADLMELFDYRHPMLNHTLST